ncbi:DUF4390 domain-containing protein [Xenophilus sp. Marseille-Q4582]|uniref:DUF4390 domain-containing protein n=1 Tax=Xenophilus sp. Marseille-Q4582 TaxID=2866600 RepID=UPI00351CEC75
MPWVSTTASSTPCCKSRPAEREGLARRRLLGGALGLGACLLAAAPPVAWAQGAELAQLRLERTGDELYLSAALRLALPAPVQDVLDKGIALHFVAEAEIIRQRWYWLDQRVAHVVRHMRLAYQPLTRRWRLNISPVPITSAISGVTLNQNFDSLEEALQAVGRIGRLRLGEVRDIGEERVLPVVFRFRLDTSQLPRPFQIGLMGQSDWNLAVERSEKLNVETVP